MTLIDCIARVTPLDGESIYDLPAGISISLSLLPPGASIVLSFPPFTIILNAAQVAELIAELSLLALEL